MHEWDDKDWQSVSEATRIAMRSHTIFAARFSLPIRVGSTVEGAMKRLPRADILGLGVVQPGCEETATTPCSGPESAENGKQVQQPSWRSLVPCNADHNESP